MVNGVRGMCSETANTYIVVGATSGATVRARPTNSATVPISGPWEDMTTGFVLSGVFSVAISERRGKDNLCFEPDEGMQIAFKVLPV